MDLFENLNPSQKDAVLCVNGPLIIFAGAGTGKTRVITHRIAYLISQGVPPWQILGVTFTNKAADEMKKRVNELVPNGAGSSVYLSTFHSFCAYFLRVEAQNIKLNPDFLIYDFADQKNIIKDCMRELNLDEKRYKPSSITDRISRAKDDLKTYQDMEDDAAKSNDFVQSATAKIYKLYQNKLKTAAALDFGDLIMQVVFALKEYPALLEKYQDRFKYILVDEYQDTNRAQYVLINLLAAKHKNLCVVGDDDQCLPSNALISTNKGLKSIDKISKKDILLSASGYGKTMESKIENIKKKKYKGLLVHIETKSGKKIEATANHIAFARLNPKAGIYYVYLMYKEGVGYRIGQTQGVRSRKKGDLANGLAIRLNQEHADKMWIIKTVSKKEEAVFYEQFLSVKYGIPTIVFNAYTNNKDKESQIKQSFCDKMFEEIDTKNNVLKLMSDYNIFEEYPHHQPKAVIRGQTARRFINLNFFAGRQTGKDKGWHSHRISLNTSGDKIKNNLKNVFNIRRGRKNTWRIETERAKYDEAEKFAKKILSFYDFDLSIKAKLTKNKSFYAMPFSHLNPFMTIPILQNGKIIEDEIRTVSNSDYDGFVYDITVADFRQFAANGMIVHNSVYSWRGADINNILDFEKDYPGAKSVKLEQNYRSTPKILNTAWQVVHNNASRIDKKLWTQNADDGGVSVLKTINENDEAAKVANIISIKNANGGSLSDCAVFYRTNAQSRVFEDAFRRAGIPYTVIGTLRFYDRAEIKNIMAYLKLIHNPNDNVSFKRIINIPKRGIGKTSMENLETESVKRDLSIWQTIPFIKEININRNAAAAIEAFVVLIKGFMALKETESVRNIVEKVISYSGYLKELEIENTPESQTKIENIKELITAVEDFENRSPDKTLSGYLTQISLVSDMDSYDDSKGKAVLMTLHLAKGLEFENVFICGLEEGLFPIGETSFFPQDLEEERRLMYVGMTRAKKNLYLCWAAERMLYGKTKWNLLSRFVIEAGFKDDFAAENRQQRPPPSFQFGRLPKKIWTPNESQTPKNRKSGFAPIDYIPSDDEIIQDEPKDNSPYQIGKMVLHQVFGAGKIIEKSGSSNDLKLVVLFENGQWKKLLAKVANLKII